MRGAWYFLLGMKCITPGCGKKAMTRGLCSACYPVARGLIRAKKTTWEDMEARGVARKAIKRGFVGRAKWLATGKVEVVDEDAHDAHQEVGDKLPPDSREGLERAMEMGTGTAAEQAVNQDNGGAA